MEKLFGHRGFRLFIPLIDLLIIYGINILCFYIFKDYLDNFTANWNSFNALKWYIFISYLIISHIFELDRPKDFSFFGVSYTVTLVIFLLFCTTMALSFMAREFAFPRSILIVGSLMQIVILSIWHVFTNRMFRRVNKLKSVLIVGYAKSKSLAYKLLEGGSMWSGVKCICKPTNPMLYNYISECDVTFLTEDIDEETKQDIVEFCVRENRRVLYEPKNPEILLFNAHLVQVDDTPVLDVKYLGISAESESLKRILDVLVSILGIIVFFIPFIIVFISLKLGGRSAIYSQERITRNGKIFKILKFRTMIENAEAKSGPVLAQDADNRVTRFGHILRATRLDEIPQIFNVLKGDMSIVGPRPERPFFVDQFCKEIPEYNLRHRVKAGLTGLAQVQGRYNTTVRDKLKYDLLYINGYSIALDIKLIMQTLNILLRKSSTQGLKKPEDLDKQITELYRD